MDDAIRTVRIDDTHRVKVYADDGPVNPRKDWEMSTGALSVNVDSRTIDVEPVYEFPGDLLRAHRSIPEAVAPSQARTEPPRVGVPYRYMRTVEESVIRWARIFHGIEMVYEDGTYWWVDPGHLTGWTPVGEFEGTPLYRYGAGPELITMRELQLRIIASDQLTYQQWADGEVYGLRVEEFKLKVKVHIGIDEAGEPFSLDEYLPSGDAEDHWEEVQAVWGFYVNAWDDAAVIAEAKELY